MLSRSIVLLLAALFAASGQEKSNLFNAAPPEIEKALRDRVAGFYQAYVDGKFRAAEQFVAEDTKDIHYNQEKTKIRAFEIVRINWEDGFKKAAVVTTVHTSFQMRGQNIPAAAGMATRWKLENGQWFYYVDAAKGTPSPMGEMRPGTGKRPDGLKIDDLIKDPSVILNQIKVSKESFLLKSWEASTDFVTVTNGMPGSVTIDFRVDPTPGLTFKIDKKELAAGEVARIELTYAPPDKRAKPAIQSTIRVDPFNRNITVPVVFDIPSEVKSQLPKK